MESDIVIGVFSGVRLAEGLAISAISVYYRRWIVLLFGLSTIALAIPVGAIALGWSIPDLPLATIVILHAAQAAFVLGATISSAGQIRRLREVIAAAGVHLEEEGWRP